MTGIKKPILLLLLLSMKLLISQNISDVNFSVPVCEFDPNPIVIENDLTWEDYDKINSIVKITNGATLTITGRRAFVEDAKIIVEVGSKLIIDGGILTNACDGLWKGIEVWGNPLLPQIPLENQGYIYLKNGAVIKNAETAIAAIKIVEYDTPDYDFSGGIVFVNNSDFINNKTAVALYPYSENYLCSFYKCKFKTTQLLYDKENPNAFVTLSGVKGVFFEGCKFSNTASLEEYYPGVRGFGIFSYNADYVVKEACLSQVYPCEEILPSSFSNLCYGILALVSDRISTVRIENNEFVNNYSHIFLSGLSQPEINMNNFLLNSGELAFNNYSGLYLDYCTGYQVEENSFVSDDMQHEQAGIVVNNSGIEPNELYNNYFENLGVGVLAQEENRNADGSEGLEIKCNDFTICEYDIAVTQEDQHATGLGVKYEQGQNGNLTIHPGGNIFTINPPHPEESNYYNPYSEEVKYWYHKYDDGYNIEPIEHTPFPQVDPDKVDADLTYNPDLSCPSNLSSGGGIEDMKSEMLLAEIKIDSTEQALATLVDGGDTPVLNNEVLTSTPDEALELRNELLSESPYLSDTVMISAVQRENVLLPVMITEVLTANPQSAKSNRVMEEVNNRVNPLSDDQITDIEQGWFVQGAKEVLEAKLSGHKADKYRAMYSIIRYYKNDTANPASQDSIVKILKNENRTWAKYDLAFHYLNAYDTLNSDNVMDSIPILFDLTTAELIQYNLYSDYYDIVRELKIQVKSIIQIDSSQKQTLYSIYNNAKGELKAYVKNALIVADTLTYNEPYIFPVLGLKSNRLIMKPVGDSKNEELFKVYPNPARTFIIVEFNSKLTESNTMIQLIDAGGKLLETTYSNARPYIALEVEHLPNGVYFIKLDSNNLQDVEKITINR